MRPALAILPLIIFLSSCAEFPALDGTVSTMQANAAIPNLVPLSYLIHQANTADRASPFVEAAIITRLAKLRIQAERLRGAMLPISARSRMLRDIQVYGQ
jgi:hypothetical protein